jgi:hypothetical protein
MTALYYAVLPDIYPKKVKHSLGLPPELTGGVDFQQEFGPAAVLIIEVRQSDIFLYRYDVTGKPVGDTWHQTFDEVQEQAEFEYQVARSAWHEMPGSVDNAVSYALRKRKDRDAKD